MVSNRIQRQPMRRRSTCSAAACGCLSAFGLMLAVVIAGFFLFRSNLTGIAAQVMGFSQRGSTELLFESVTPIPTVQIQNPVEPPQIMVDAGQYGSQVLTTDSSLYRVQVGTDSTGAQAATVTMSEAAVQQLCRERSPVCGPNNPRYRNAQIDLRPGGAVVYADVAIPELGNVEQRVGAVLRLDSSGQRFQFAGVDLNGTIYDVPPQTFGDTVNELEQRGNDLLNQLRVDAGGTQFSLSQVSISDDSITVLLR